MDNLALKVENVTKQYRLGAIGGTTLRDEVARFFDKFRKNKTMDPLEGDGRKIGDKFMALNGVSFEIKKGEAVGIIGHNGAGKSTLLKLLSRVTGPTTGTISFNGRISSMLEVGTGFHPELTGRENIYMNGAILGMNRAEVNSKIEQIIDFSEVRQFIDTPVKRYSSGMYVKLAFSVAAHLDSEIMIMDEVLAVGDMAFQKKCLEKMSSAAQVDGKTVLYVSHNMNTIRQLCTRCIVMSKGKVIFDGDVEKAIELYLGKALHGDRHNDFMLRQKDSAITADIKIKTLDLQHEPAIASGDKMSFALTYDVRKEIKNLSFRFTVLQPDRTAVGSTSTAALPQKIQTGKQTKFELDTSCLAPGNYIMDIVAFEPNGAGQQIRHDYVSQAVAFEVIAGNAARFYNLNWSLRAWGTQVFPEAKILENN